MATRLNTQLPLYISLVPDPHAIAVDCFPASWKSTNPCFSPLHLQCGVKNLEGSTTGESPIDNSSSIMAPSTVVSTSVSHDHRYSTALASIRQSPHYAPEGNQDTETSQAPFPQPPQVDGFQYLRSELGKQGIPSESADYILKGWRDSTKSQYRLYFRKWIQFCDQQQSNPFLFDEKNVLAFLTHLFNNGLSTSGVGTAKAAIHAILGAARGDKINTSFCESLMMKGFFNTRPSLPRYATTWDVNLLLASLRDMPSNELLSLKELNIKIASLFTILLGQRIQTICSLNIDFINITNSGLEIVFNSLLKTSRVGHHLPKTTLPRWHDEGLCPVSLFSVLH